MKSLHRQSQQGATLIIVLFVLLLVIIIGVISVRQSMTSLDVSTADQVGKVLFQSGDAALMKIEKQDRNDSEAVDANMTLRGNVLNLPVGQQIVFCLRPRQKELFEVSQFSQRNSDATGNVGITYNGIQGFCDASNKDDYISPSRVITQVYLAHEPMPPNSETFHSEARLTASDDIDTSGDGTGSLIMANNFKVYTVSVLPAFTGAELGNKKSAGTDSVSGCFKQPINMASTSTNPNVDDCLKALGVPYHVQVQEYDSQSQSFPSV